MLDLAKKAVLARIDARTHRADVYLIICEELVRRMIHLSKEDLADFVLEVFDARDARDGIVTFIPNRSSR